MLRYSLYTILPLRVSWDCEASKNKNKQESHCLSLNLRAFPPPTFCYDLMNLISLNAYLSSLMWLNFVEKKSESSLFSDAGAPWQTKMSFEAWISDPPQLVSINLEISIINCATSLIESKAELNFSKHCCKSARKSQCELELINFIALNTPLNLNISSSCWM